MESKQQQLDTMLRRQQINELSSEQQSRQQQFSRTQYRKPIRDPFSEQSDNSESDMEVANISETNTPFPPRPPQHRSVLKQAQDEMKWDKNQQLQNEILAKLEGQGMKDKKIRELASKYRNLNVAYEKQKTLRRSLQNQLNQVIKTGQILNRSGISQQRSTDKIKRKSLEKTMQSKVSINAQKCSNCSQNQKKVMEFRLKSQNSKTQVNKIMRLLTRQLGENFDIDKALSEENSWKGRQQRIQKLKARIKQLQDKLNNNGINVSHMSGFTQVTSANRTNVAGFQSTRSSAMLAENKRKELDNLKVQVDALKNQNQLLLGKVKSLTARKITLQSQVKQLKSDYQKKRQLFLQKSDNDDKFIALLKNQNEKLKKQQKVVTKVIYKDQGSDVGILKKQNQNLKKKLRVLSSLRENKQQNTPVINVPDTPKQTKDLNSRVISAEKKKKVQDQYLKSTKYLQKMSNEDEQALYKNWKNSLNKNN